MKINIIMSMEANALLLLGGERVKKRGSNYSLKLKYKHLRIHTLNIGTKKDLLTV